MNLTKYQYDVTYAGDLNFTITQHVYKASCFSAGVVEEMRCFSCDNVDVQLDEQTGHRHTDRCDFYNTENAVCESGQVSERIAKLRSTLLCFIQQ